MKILIVALALFFGVWAWKIRIYLKWKRKKKENVRLFYRWVERVHQEPEQIKRRRQASEESFSIQYQDEEKGLARIRGASDPAVYWCNLGMFQCTEFKKAHKPYKHIYKIAIDKGLIEKEEGLL